MIRPRDTAPPDSQPLNFVELGDSGGYYNALVVAAGPGLLPPGGAPGQVLVKVGRADFDAIWATPYVNGDGTGGGGTGGDIVLDSIAPIRVSGGGSAWTISIDTATQQRPGSMSAADKRRLDNLPTWRGDTPPVRALEGDLWWDTTDGTGYILYNDGTSTQWVPFSPQGAGANKEVYTSPAPPVGVAPETIWWNSEDGTGYILFDDGSSQQWVPLTPASAGTKEVYIGSTPPAGVPPESLWWDSELGRLFILYDDGSSLQWVDASPDGGGSAKEVYSGPVPPADVPPETIWWSSVDGCGYLLFDDGSSQQWVPLTPQGGENGSNDEGFYGTGT